MCIKDKNLVELLDEAKLLSFDRLERHFVADVYREAYGHYVLSHPARINSLDRDSRSEYEAVASAHAAIVARQYMREEVDKWQRRGYKKIEVQK